MRKKERQGKRRAGRPAKNENNAFKITKKITI
jgi:hypothetical protein